MLSPIGSKCSFRPKRLALAGSFVAALTAVACGGGSPSTPSAPSNPPPTGAVTVTITSAGVDPKNVDISMGQAVTFRNQDSAAHEMASNPHPVHTDCPPINQVGALGPNQSGTTGALTVARVCGYHDHGQPTNAGLQGTITIR